MLKWVLRTKKDDESARSEERQSDDDESARSEEERQSGSGASLWAHEDIQKVHRISLVVIDVFMYLMCALTFVWISGRVRL